MKKLLALLLALAMVLSMVACGAKTEAPETTAPVDATEPSGTESTEPVEEQIVVESFEGDFTYTDWVPPCPPTGTPTPMRPTIRLTPSTS